MIIILHDIDLFMKLNTYYNRIWFTFIYESNIYSEDPDFYDIYSEITVHYSNAGWESKFFFYDFFTKNKELIYRIE